MNCASWPRPAWLRCRPAKRSSRPPWSTKRICGCSAKAICTWKAGVISFSSPPVPCATSWSSSACQGKFQTRRPAPTGRIARKLQRRGTAAGRSAGRPRSAGDTGNRRSAQGPDRQSTSLHGHVHGRDGPGPRHLRADTVSSLAVHQGVVEESSWWLTSVESVLRTALSQALTNQGTHGKA